MPALVWGEVGVSRELPPRNGHYSPFYRYKYQISDGIWNTGLKAIPCLLYQDTPIMNYFLAFGSDHWHPRIWDLILLRDPSNYALSSNEISMDFGMCNVMHEKSKFKYSEAP